MEITSSPGAIQDYLEELAAATRKMERSAANKSLDSVDLGRVLEYASVVRSIHRRLEEGYDPSQGRSRIIDQFFNSWNNLVFGVFYTANLVEINNSLTGKQYEIFLLTLKNIREYLDKFSGMKK